MSRAITRPAVVFDVLGTLVDQAGSLRRRVAEVIGLDDKAAADVVSRWLDHVSAQERAIVERRRAFVPSHELDIEALGWLTGEGLLPNGSVSALADASEWLRPWPDTIAGLDALTTDVTVLGLSNASRRALTGLSSNSRLRWHQLLSAEDTGTYKPDPTLYELAISSVPAGSGPPFMAAAHAWDLRAAAAVGMRTAYVPRPDGDPPRSDDSFDLHATSIGDLCTQLRVLTENDPK